jgi:hypothetical protein
MADFGRTANAEISLIGRKIFRSKSIDGRMADNGGGGQKMDIFEKWTFLAKW